MKGVLEMTQKEAKKIKRKISEDGILMTGYICRIKENFTYDEIVLALCELEAQGLRLSNLEEWEQDAVLLTELIRQQNYQEFKSRSLPYIMC